MAGFQKRTIKKIIRDKLDKFFASIDDEPLRERMKKNTLVTGGCISSMMLGEKINDYDVYFKNKETVQEVAEYYVDKFNKEKANKRAAAGFATQEILYTPAVRTEQVMNIEGQMEDRILIYMKSAGVAGENQDPYQYFECHPEHMTDDFMASLQADEGDIEPNVELIEVTLEEVKKVEHKYRPVFLTDNAITLTDKTQLIIRFYGSPEEIHKNFDYIHCTGIYDYATDTLHTSPEMMESIISKRLIYSGSLYPIASVLRMRKFLKRGWNISAGQVLKMLSQMQKIDWSDPKILKEQLMGVDVAYMHQLISALQNREPGQRIDATYLAGLLDTIFDES